MSASRDETPASRYQSRSSMYIRGLVLRNSMELAEAVPMGATAIPVLGNFGDIIISVRCESRITFWHQEACLVMTNSDHLDK